MARPETGRRTRSPARAFRARGHFSAVLPIALAIALSMVFSILFSGCASRPQSTNRGAYHEVVAGETLYRIGQRYGVPAAEIARANGIHDVTQLRVGQRLFIPGIRGRRDEADRRVACDDGPLRFRWPVKARLTSRFGLRGNRPHEGLDLGVPHGTPIHAAEAGRVIHSGRFGAYGNVVILKHAGDFRSVYAHARKLFVEKGDFVERGQKIAEVGSSGRATGPHLHFEIRCGEVARDPLAYLP